MSMHFRPVTVSIVIHRQWSLAEPLLRELDEHCHALIEAVVLTVNVPEPVHPDPAWKFALTIVRNATPQGFGANHNAAFARCATPWFLILNPDVRIGTGAVIGELMRRARASAGLLAPRIREPGRSAPEPFRGLLSPVELIRRRLPSHRPPERPEWVAGMFMLVRREAFAGVGGFDPRFFMYCEDFDLCARLRLAGWELQVDDDLSVTHMAQRHSQSSVQPFLWHLASFWKVWTSSAFWRYRARLRRARPHP